MKIVAIMVVKNEIKLLPQCLNSIRELVDSIVIVDTGSTDGTLEYIKNAGIKVYEREWTNNFSTHRNQSIKYGEKENPDWLFVIDADEEVIYEGKTAQQIREDLEHADSSLDVIGLLLHDVQNNIRVMQMNHPRFFRPGSIKYKFNRHNKPIFGTQMGVHPDIHLNHYGYCKQVLGEEKYKQKQKARTEGLLKMLKDYPEECSTYFYLNQNYSVLGQIEESVKYGIQYINFRKKLGNEFNTNVYFTTLKGLMSLKSVKSAQKILADAIEHGEPDLDLSLIMVEMGIWLGKEELVIMGAEKYLNLYQAIQADPSLTSCKFLFTYNIDSMGYVVSALALTRVQQGLFQLQNLKNLWSHIQDVQKLGLLTNLKRNFENVDFCEILNQFEITQEDEPHE